VGKALRNAGWSRTYKIQDAESGEVIEKPGVLTPVWRSFLRMALRRGWRFKALRNRGPWRYAYASVRGPGTVVYRVNTTCKELPLLIKIEDEVQPGALTYDIVTPKRRSRK
jgi:hypothetical protein